MFKKQFPFIFITASVFIFLVVSSLIQDGMFMDGLIYATVAKNFANGQGTWWNLYLNNSGFASYHDQPPLTLWIQAFFFKVLGNGMYTERIYCFITSVVTALMILLVWRKKYEHNPGLVSISWLPVLMWIIIPVCFWSYANNLQENTMVIFVLLSAYFILKGFETNKITCFIIAGTFIFLATLCKGVQGAFTVVMPIVFFMVYRKPAFYKAALYSLILFAVPMFIYFLLFQNDVISKSFHDYFDTRLVRTFTDSNAETTTQRFYLIKRLFTELLVPVLLCLVIFFLANKKSKGKSADLKTFLLFFLTGLCGTLPLLVTKEQRGFYLVTALPFYAIAMASVVAEKLSTSIELLNENSTRFKWFNRISLVVLISAISFSVFQFGKTRRDAEMLHDVYILGKIIPSKSVILVERELRSVWSLHLYLARYYDITPDIDSEKNLPFYLMRPSPATPDSMLFEEVHAGLTEYRLFKRKQTSYPI